MSPAPYITAAAYRKDLCHKKSYTSRSKSEASIQRIGDFGIHPYKCKVCNRWHIGHKLGSKK